MNIVILGAGEVGYNIAQRLAVDGNNVSVVDNNEERLQRVADNMDVQTVLGNAAQPSILRRAGAADAELLIAATAVDEVNMLACQVAHSLFQVTTKMARIRNHDYMEHANQLFGRDDLPIDLVISPEKEAAKAVVRRFLVSDAVDMQEFADGRISLVGVRIPPKSDLVGMAVGNLAEVVPSSLPLNIVAHEHNGVWRVPGAGSVLLVGDTIYAAVERKHVDRFMAVVGLDVCKQTERNVMVVGGGNIGFQVARSLLRLGAHVKVIEHNHERSEWLAEHLDRGTVIQGDALDRSLLEEEAIRQMDDFLALTNDDEVNILSSLISRQYEVPHTVTLINRDIYGGLLQVIGLSNVVSPRFTTAASILRHVRRGRVYGLSTVGDGSLEVLEAEAMETSQITSAPLAALRLPESTLIGAVVRGEEVIIPDGACRVEAGDHVVVVTRRASLAQVERLFEVHLEFF
ncbi:MAG: Trk system potassium transporter TrkA [Zetaproteobacteria bacterium]|nr:MAG: Trk system potassium transporter TrkA [Zetaproteobacteria bacterium]